MNQKISAKKQDVSADFSKLPKVELHRHMEGAMRLETLWELHQLTKQDKHLSFDAFRQSVQVPSETKPGFLDFLERFNGLRFYYGDEQALARIARDEVASAAADGVVHLEVRFSPSFYARRMIVDDPTQFVIKKQGDNTKVLKNFPQPPKELVELAAKTIIENAKDEAAKYDMSLSFILCLGRHFGVPANKPSSDLLDHPLGALFVGLDVAGNESVPLKELDVCIRPWKEAGKKLTIHAGEDQNGPGAANVREAIEAYGADRIGHGVRALEDKNVLALLKERGIPLEVCPTSNVQTKAAASYVAHPILDLMQEQIKVTINSDDPLICNVKLSDEFCLLHERAKLSFEQLRELALNGVDAAFVSETQRQIIRERIESAWVR